ncbi:tRNA (guanosine(37)-N1)-methyltransferase TrmD [Candidatus Saccharibacteria bacterium]|nr:tRNA (guanosine(37)-N1)-methyltransferase TrmD [Candidatus Saccharibacteria bacterium]MCL1963336.1 tRNA (guanosine(37)-N1)-methyltransferase TrmD [Candidatus Saccharibacteria bacterium]
MKLIQIVTLFPEMFDGALGSSMMWKAQNIGAAKFEVIDLRGFGLGVRRRVDDTPYGGGDGMLLMIEPLMNAVEFAKKRDESAVVMLTSARGEIWRQEMARAAADDERGLIIICGHYEGVDERILSVVDQEISLGKFVMTGGEIPAMAIVDSVVRLLPDVLGGEKSAEIESFSDGETLEFPQYTRPAEFRGMNVPEVLLNGNHAEIAKWRAENSRKG